MAKKMIKLKYVPIGGVFKYYGALYTKISDAQEKYINNVQRVDNHKETHLNGHWLVEVVE